MPECQVRRYEPRDRERLCEICYATGLMGESIARLFGSRRLFTDFWMTYYLEHEPESAFVAVEDGEAVGYLVGCRDSRKFEDVQHRLVWPMLWRRLFTGRYGVPLPVVRFAWHVLSSQVKDENIEPPLHLYPAHLHMNMAAGHRRQGHGSRLMAAYLAHLEADRVRGVHLLTTNLNREAVPFYEKWEFQLHKRASVSTYAAYLTEPVEALLYVRAMPQPAPVGATP